MKTLLRSKIFWIVFALAAVIFFIAGIVMSKTYKSEMRILLLPRSDVAARNIDQILRNAEEIPKSLSFYNKMLELNPDIEDDLSDMSDSQRKNSWNDKIKVERVRKSGVIKIDAFSDVQLQAEIISRQIVASDIAVLSKYYDITTDLDIRIIDGPIAYIVSKINFWMLFSLSLILGIVIGCVIYFIVKFFPKNENILNLESLREYLKPAGEKASKKINECFPFSNKKLEAFEENYTFEKKACAPENLPVAAEESIFTSKTEEDQSFVAPKSSENVSQIVSREATPEEVKARLNKLLNS